MEKFTIMLNEKPFLTIENGKVLDSQLITDMIRTLIENGNVVSIRNDLIDNMTKILDSQGNDGSSPSGSGYGSGYGYGSG